MTPDEYRTMFGLPRDYPMVAPGLRQAAVEPGKVAWIGTQGCCCGSRTGSSTGTRSSQEARTGEGGGVIHCEAGVE